VIERLEDMPVVAFLGPSRAGKDECAEWFSANTVLPYGGPTSRVIAPYAAARLGLTEDQAYARRHEDRALWHQLGREIRQADAAALVRAVLKKGRIVVGVRDRIEMLTANAEGLIDLSIWVDRPMLADGSRLPADPTLEYGPELCDLILPNRWGVAELHERLRTLAASIGVLRVPKAAPDPDAVKVLLSIPGTGGQAADLPAAVGMVARQLDGQVRTLGSALAILQAATDKGVVYVTKGFDGHRAIGLEIREKGGPVHLWRLLDYRSVEAAAGAA
jgi:hypothetical protein